MIWKNRENIRLCAVVQGIFEGSIDGLAYTIVFLMLLWAVAGWRCHFSSAVSCIRTCLLIALGTWLAGGIYGVAHAVSSPHDFPLQLFGWRDASDSTPVVQYAWVLGSIWGVDFGSIVPIIAVAIRFAMQNRAAARTEPRNRAA